LFRRRPRDGHFRSSGQPSLGSAVIRSELRNWTCGCCWIARPAGNNSSGDVRSSLRRGSPGSNRACHPTTDVEIQRRRKLLEADKVNVFPSLRSRANCTAVGRKRPAATKSDVVTFDRRLVRKRPSYTSVNDKWFRRLTIASVDFMTFSDGQLTDVLV